MKSCNGGSENPPASKKTNSRWQRSKSPEKKSRFPAPEKKNNFVRSSRDSRDSRDNRDKPRYNKGGFGKFRYNHGKRGPSIFDNVKKDNLGRPMLAGATTSGFDIGAALQKSKNKSKKKEKNKKVEKKETKEKPTLVPFKKDEKTEEQLKAEAEWNKQMILNMQYEWETDSDQEEEEEEDTE